MKANRTTIKGKKRHRLLMRDTVSTSTKKHAYQFSRHNILCRAYLQDSQKMSIIDLPKL